MWLDPSFHVVLTAAPIFPLVTFESNTFALKFHMFDVQPIVALQVARLDGALASTRGGLRGATAEPPGRGERSASLSPHMRNMDKVPHGCSNRLFQSSASFGMCEKVNSFTPLPVWFSLISRMIWTLSPTKLI